jgi:hypothetical protein
LITFLSPEIVKSISIQVPFHCHGLWCSVYYSGWFCQLSLVDYIIWLHYLHNLFLLILVRTRTSVRSHYYYYYYYYYYYSAFALLYRNIYIYIYISEKTVTFLVL